jgi:hypothetical protein
MLGFSFDFSVPIAVGKSLLSGEDMYMSGMRGKCMIILHMHNDNLWSMGDRSLPVPNIPIQISSRYLSNSFLVDINKVNIV